MNNIHDSLNISIAGVHQSSRHAGLNSWLLEGRLVIFDFMSLEMAVYTPSAAVIWLLLVQGTQTRAHLAREFAGIYDLPETQAQHDIAQCLQDWQQRGWLLTNEHDEISIHNRPAAPVLPDLKRDPASTDTAPGRIIHSVAYQLHEAAFVLTLTERGVQGPAGLAARLQILAQGFPLCHDQRKRQQAPVLQIIASDDQVLILKNDVLVIASSSRVQAYADVVRQILQLAYPGIIHLGLLHAAALSKAKTILFAGVSGSGKSTLSAYLASQGWNYHGDDTIGLAAHDEHSDKGAVLSFPTSVSIKQGSLGTLAALYPALAGLSTVDYNNKTARFLPLSETVPVSDTSTLEIAALVFPTFTHAAATHTERITAVEALTLLIASGIAFDRALTPAAMHQFLVILARLPIYKLVYSDLPEAQAWLDTLAKS